MTTPSTQQRETGGTGGRRTVPLSQLIYLLADHDKLGEHRQTFLLAPMSGDAVVRGCALVASGLVAVGGLCAAAGSWLGCGALGGLALVPAAIAVLRRRRNRGNRKARLDLFDHGMTVYRGAEDIVAFRWDTVEVRQQVIPFHNAATATTDYSFTLTGPGPSTATFDENVFERAGEWGPAIQSAVTATQLPGVVTAIDSEETVLFGDIAVNLIELAHAGKSYPWEHIQRIEAQHGLVCIKVDGQWISLEPVESIPNFYIFNEVAERLRLAALEEANAAAAEERAPVPNGTIARPAVTFLGGAVTPTIRPEPTGAVSGQQGETVGALGAAGDSVEQRP
ncbi:DUF6585 family protein [Nocardia wallacei]|uniref:DUF6585 family protein n=1 Tax=Nocardia wallacei TaxID=480035 RepID=UPI00245748AA|nr:DUF6585 family protein [Nocardia wallacei]